MLTETVAPIDWDQHRLSQGYSYERMRFVFRALAKFLSDKLRRTLGKKPENVYYLNCCHPKKYLRCFKKVVGQMIDNNVLFFFHVARYFNPKTSDKF